MRKGGLISLGIVWSLLIVLPVAALLGESFQAQFWSAGTWGLLFNSLLLGAFVSLLSTLLGTLAAFLLAKGNLPFKPLLKILLLIPLLLPPYIFTVAWVDFLLTLGVSGSFIYSMPTAIGVLALVLMPVSMLMIESALQQISPNLEASALLVSSYPAVLLQIVLPLVKPAILASLLLTFVLAVSEFTVPAFLSVRVMTTEIFTQFSAFYDYPAAITQSAWLVLLCGAGLWIEFRYIAGRPFTAISLKENHRPFLPFARHRYRLGGVGLLYTGLTAVLPWEQCLTRL